MIRNCTAYFKSFSAELHSCRMYARLPNIDNAPKLSHLANTCNVKGLRVLRHSEVSGGIMAGRAHAKQRGEERLWAEEGQHAASPGREFLK